MDLIAAGLAVAAFAAVVLVLVGAANRAQRQRPRTVADPADEGWMTTDQVASALDVSPAQVMELVRRDAIPHFLVLGGNRDDAADFRFRRDEIDTWVID